MATKPAPRRVAIYTRVSLDRRDTGRSVAEQETELRATSAREGWDVVDVFVDNDRSASRYARKPRPAFLRLRQAVADARCDVVAVWELSRLSRDLGALVAFRDECRTAGVVWSVGGRQYDPGDDSDTLPLIVQACQAESESASTSKRVRRAMNAGALDGRPHGRLTYGYRREYDPTTKAFVAQVVDDGQAAILREIADRFLAGEAFYTIARDLTARGVPTPAAATRNGGTVWHPTNCARLLKNPAYVGRRMQNGQYVAEAQWPAIFTDDEWALLRNKLTDPARTSHKESAVRYLLTGFAICGSCGSNRMSTVKGRDVAGRRSYMCAACFGVARRVEPTDERVEAKIIERLSSPDLADLYGRAEADSASAAASARERAAVLRGRLADFEAQAGDGAISAAAFGRIEAKLTGEIDEADAAAQRASVPAAVRHLAGVDHRRVAAIWDALTIVERREALRAIGARVVILPVGKGRRVFDPESVRVTFPVGVS